MKIAIDAPAKINLFLQVGPTGSDGYHPVRTVMQTVEVCDHLEMELASGEGWCEVEPAAAAEQLGDPAGNLAWRAWEAFAAGAGLIGGGLRLKLAKRIPLAAGLGGGSADAAAVLFGLERMLSGPLGHERLSSVAAGLGSDVPFFLAGGTALAEGRGEKITPLAPAPCLQVVLANPGLPLSTAAVYRRFDEMGERGFERTDLEGFLGVLETGETRALLAAIRNDLEASCLAMSEEAAGLREGVTAALGGLVSTGINGAATVSGSGPTIFALLQQEAAAQELAGALERFAPMVIRTRFRPDGCRVRG